MTHMAHEECLLRNSSKETLTKRVRYVIELFVDYILFPCWSSGVQSQLCGLTGSEPELKLFLPLLSVSIVG